MARTHRRSAWLYILEVRGGAYYTGYALNLVRRYRRHLAGTGARFTRSFPPVRIAQCWRVFAEPGALLRLELLVKRTGRAAKERLIRSPEILRPLARARLGMRGGPYVFDPARVEAAARDPSVPDEPDPFAPLPRRDHP